MSLLEAIQKEILNNPDEKLVNSYIHAIEKYSENNEFSQKDLYEYVFICKTLPSKMIKNIPIHFCKSLRAKMKG